MFFLFPNLTKVIFKKLSKIGDGGFVKHLIPNKQQGMRKIIQQELVNEAAARTTASIQSQSEFKKTLENRVLKRGVSSYASGE